MNPHIKWNTFSIRLASPRSLTARDFLSVCPAENLCKNDRFFCCCFVVDQTHSECQETHWKRERENTHKCENSNNKTSQIDICANRSQINYYYVIFNDLLSLNQINEWEWSDFGWSVFDCIIIYMNVYIRVCMRFMASNQCMHIVFRWKYRYSITQFMLWCRMCKMCARYVKRDIRSWFSQQFYTFSLVVHSKRQFGILAENWPFFHLSFGFFTFFVPYFSSSLSLDRCTANFFMWCHFWRLMLICWRF